MKWPQQHPRCHPDPSHACKRQGSSSGQGFLPQSPSKLQGLPLPSPPTLPT